MTLFLTSLYFSMGSTKEHCTEIVKLNYLNQSSTTFVQTMNVILPEPKGIYRKHLWDRKGIKRYVVHLRMSVWGQREIGKCVVVKTFQIEIYHQWRI